MSERLRPELALQKHRFPLAVKLVLLMLFAALLPLALFGLLSVIQVRQATTQSIIQGNLRVSQRAAEQIQQYISNALVLLQATAENINQAALEPWQQEQILRNYHNRFNQFNALTLWDLNEKPLVTSELQAPKSNPLVKEALAAGRNNASFLSPVYIKNDLTPAMLVAFPTRQLGEVHSVLVAELNLIHMWALIDGIKVGYQGIVHIVSPQGQLLATGDGTRKKNVLLQQNFEPLKEIPAILNEQGHVFKSPLGNEVLAVGTKLAAPLSWSILVEQPVSEAYALAHRMTHLLAGFMLLFLLLVFAVAYIGGKRNILNPIRALTTATQELAAAKFDYRLQIDSQDEFSELANAFNQMAKHLKELQTKLILEERHAMFGRIAAGLAHDLKHPIQAIETASHLMDKMYQNPEFRETFNRTVRREFAKVNDFLQNLHNLTHEIPYRPVSLSLKHVLEETLATFIPRAQQERHHITATLLDVSLEADGSGLNRAFSNLISNALEAMKEPGRLSVIVNHHITSIDIVVADSGSGIEPDRLLTLFEDFTTTKRRGLGLGLAITKKIIEQHHGRIIVRSQVGQGTTFTVTLPLNGSLSG